MSRIPTPVLPDVRDSVNFLAKLLDLLRKYATALNNLIDGRQLQFVSVTTTYPATENDHVILVAPAAPFTITLPAASAMIGKQVIIKRTNTTTHTITLTPVSGLIETAASATLTTSLQRRAYYSDGVAYWEIT